MCLIWVLRYVPYNIIYCMCMQCSDDHNLWVSWHRLLWQWLKSVESRLVGESILLYLWQLWYLLYSGLVPWGLRQFFVSVSEPFTATHFRSFCNSFQKFLREKVRGSQSVISSLAKPETHVVESYWWSCVGQWKGSFLGCSRTLSEGWLLDWAL